MFRIAHILVTIASLLACPLNCLGHVAEDGASESQGCACCGHHCPADAASNTGFPEEDRTPSEDDGCQCGNCLCEGAILTDNDPLLNVASSTFAVAALFDGLADQCFASAAIGFPAVDLSPPLALLAGRCLRYAIESLQI